MSRSDKLLWGIVAAILGLVVVAVAIVWLRPEASYRPDDSPENIVHNYLLALQRQDNERAYGYLSPDLNNYPFNLNDFNSAVRENDYQFRQGKEYSLSVVSAEIDSLGARVNVIEQVPNSGSLFGSGSYQRTLSFSLEQIDGSWKISDGTAYFDPYWSKR